MDFQIDDERFKVNGNFLLSYLVQRNGKVPKFYRVTHYANTKAHFVRRTDVENCFFELDNAEEFFVNWKKQNPNGVPYTLVQVFPRGSTEVHCHGKLSGDTKLSTYNIVNCKTTEGRFVDNATFYTCDNLESYGRLINLWKVPEMEKSYLFVFPDIIHVKEYSDIGTFGELTDTAQLTTSNINHVLKNDSHLIRHFPEQTEQWQLTALQDDPSSFQWFVNPTDKVISIALRELPRMIEFVPHNRQTQSMNREVVRRQGTLIEFCACIEFNDVQLTAVKQTGYALGPIMDYYSKVGGEPSRNVYMTALSQNGLALQFAPDAIRKDIEFIEVAVEQNSFAFKYSLIQPPALVEIALQGNPYLAPYVHNPENIKSILWRYHADFMLKNTHIEKVSSTVGNIIHALFYDSSWVAFILYLLVALFAAFGTAGYVFFLVGIGSLFTAINFCDQYVQKLVKVIKNYNNPSNTKNKENK